MHLMLDRNTCCARQTLDRDRLETILSAPLGSTAARDLAVSHPHLFAGEEVFITRQNFAAMRQTVQTLESLLRGPAWRDLAVGGFDPPLADPGTLGVFSSYDFHLTSEGPALIEINTNAGGAFLAAACAEAHGRCCAAYEAGEETVRWEPERIAAMFLSEWRLSGRGGAPRRIAIIDDDPPGQFLYPEFELARALFAEAGFETLIADAGDLDFSDGALRAGGRQIDLVYNRLTDFYLDAPGHGALRAAMTASAAVVTPHPFHHALLADKRNLARLTTLSVWDRLGLSEAQRDVLRRLPRAELVTAETAERLWAERRDWFFKPVAGFGARGVYRGDKLTRRTWEAIVAGGYIAQRLALPSNRLVRSGETEALLKTDIRLYAYGADILFVAARLYQGQTTNMRTQGGGFAPVRIGRPDE